MGSYSFESRAWKVWYDYYTSSFKMIQKFYNILTIIIHNTYYYSMMIWNTEHMKSPWILLPLPYSTFLHIHMNYHHSKYHHQNHLPSISISIQNCLDAHVYASFSVFSWVEFISLSLCGHHSVIIIIITKDATKDT